MIPQSVVRVLGRCDRCRRIRPGADLADRYEPDGSVTTLCGECRHAWRCETCGAFNPPLVAKCPARNTRRPWWRRGR